MNSQDGTIYGLTDSISVLENKGEQPPLASDILFNNNTEDLVLPYDEFIHPAFDYYPYDYMDAVSLLDIAEETFQVNHEGDVI